MKIYGYSKNVETDSPLTLSEVTLSTNSHDLRKLAKFLDQVASKIDAYGNEFEHEHLSENFASIEGQTS